MAELSGRLDLRSAQIQRPMIGLSRRRVHRWGLWVTVVLIVVWPVFPFLWQVNASLQPDKELVRSAPKWLPVPGTPVPMTLPGVVTAGLLGFIASWNEFMLALSFTSSPQHQTIPVGIANFTDLYFVPWGGIAAASVVVTVPLVLLVLIFQRRIVAGLTAGAVKE
jgi:ABC-type glycerol-3-phosphate transport system permease component